MGKAKTCYTGNGVCPYCTGAFTIGYFPKAKEVVVAESCVHLDSTDDMDYDVAGQIAITFTASRTVRVEVD